MFVKSVYDFEKKIESLNIHKVSVATWYLLKFYLNIAAPICYKLTKRKEQKSVRRYTDKTVIVSFTTFPARMKTLPIVIESLFRQTVKPDRIILWLADTQYPDKNNVTAQLKSFIEQGLEVKYCDDLRSHKKYYYTMKENPEAIVVTVDDDIIYPEDMLEKLLKAHRKYPNCIVANRAHKITFNEKKLCPYSMWLPRAGSINNPDMLLCPTTGAGCLFPPNSVSHHCFDIELIKTLCFNADDIWLKCMTFINNSNVVVSESRSPEIIDVLGNKKNGLAKLNVEQDFNTEQINRVSEFFNIDWFSLR